MENRNDPARIYGDQNDAKMPVVKAEQPSQNALGEHVANDATTRAHATKREAVRSISGNRSKKPKKEREPVNRATATATTHDDIQVEREDSAWDALGERFKDAADAGRCIDLTGDSGEGAKTVSRDEAASDFASLPTPVNPSTIVHDALAPSSRPEDENPELQPLWNILKQVIEALQKAREKVSQALEARNGWGSAKSARRGRLRSIICDINRKMSVIQQFCNDHPDAVVNSNKAVEKVESMNRLVAKANVFIDNFNSRV